MNTKPTWSESRCSIARSLSVLGEKWTLLIVREAHLGRTRFADFRSRLGVAPDVLTDRLTKLVAAGILDRRSYREPGEREREEYVLSEAGRELLPVMAALAGWGEKHRHSEFGPSALYTDASTGRPVQLAFVGEDGRPVPVDEVAVVPGPGALPG